MNGSPNANKKRNNPFFDVQHSSVPFLALTTLLASAFDFNLTTSIVVNNSFGLCGFRLFTPTTTWVIRFLKAIF
jgi:hypothetical protein